MVHRGAAVVLGLASGVFAFAAVFGLTHSIPAGVVVALAATAVVAWATGTGRVFAFDEDAVPKSYKVASAVVSVLALILLTRLTVFMVDPSKVNCSANPFSQWEIGHSCLTAYHIAGKLVGVENVYSPALYNAPEDNPSAPRKARKLGPFNVDVFEYPPPFLLLPRALRLLTPDFQPFRMLWFGLNGAFILIAMVVTARMLGPMAGTRAVLLTPLAWLFLPPKLV